jgi:hypothetical protein
MVLAARGCLQTIGLRTVPISSNGAFRKAAASAVMNFAELIAAAASASIDHDGLGVSRCKQGFVVRLP